MASQDAVKDIPARGAVFRTAALWLLFLAPFFYLTYGTANWWASRQPDVPELAFGWEAQIPFLAWTIVPYWSINLFYALALFSNETPEDVGKLARRYLTAQVIAVTCFVLFPLRAIFVRPETYGLPGFMFDVLGGFDKPFNQAPSLHIALLVIIWDHFRARLRGPLLLAWHVWCALIGISVLTTWQHHFIDIPTGLLLGLFALWLFPAGGRSPLAGFTLTADKKARRLAKYYAYGALLFLAATVFLTSVSGAGLLLIWPAIALSIVALGYAGAGPGIFQKGAQGQTSLASCCLLMPYRAGVRLNMKYWTAKLSPSVEIAEGIHLGRFPTYEEARHFASVLDMTGELPGLQLEETAWRAFPTLDLLPLPSNQLERAIEALDDMRAKGPVLVCCALGFQRSATVVAGWLLVAGKASTAAEAIALLSGKGRPVHLGTEAIEALTGARR